MTILSQYKSGLLLGVLMCASLLLFSQQVNKPNSQTQTPAVSGGYVVHAPSVTFSGVKINYVRTRNALGKISDANFGSASYLDVNEATQYFDGLGRPFQRVSRQVSPGTKDIVEQMEYDVFGREAYKYLPYVQTSGTHSSDGVFKTNPYSDQLTFYNTVYKDVDNQLMYAGEQVFYGKTIFENSPLNREVKSFAPGNSWAGSEGSISEKATSTQYLLNTSLDAVRMWTISNDDLVYTNNDVTTNIPTSLAVYGANTLLKNVFINEAGNAEVEYKNNEGLVILKKVQVGTIASDFSGYTGFLCTYYIYDDLNRLRFVIPPKAVETINGPWALSPDMLINELCFRYEYDKRNRMIAKKVPGAGWSYMIYDRRDRLVFIQDANMGNNNQWLTTLYDVLNRPVITGMITYNGNRNALQIYVDANTGNGATASINNSNPGIYNLEVSLRVTNPPPPLSGFEYKARKSITLNPGFESVTNDVFETIIDPNLTIGTESITIVDNPLPTSNNFIALTITYYDDYSWTNNTYSTSNNSQLTICSGCTNMHEETLPSASVQQQVAIRGMVTGVKVRVIEDPANLSAGAFLTTANFYDDHLRVIQTQSDNYKGGSNVTTILYDFTDKPLTTYLVHNNPASSLGTTTLKSQMQYDHAGRLLKIWKTINNNSTILIVSNEYDELGNLKKKELGRKKDANGYTSTPVETLDYNYNIRGWLKAINKDYANNTAPNNNNRWFGMELNYDWGFGTNQFNGNIAGTKWRSKGDGEKRAFGYTYDQVNRLLGADFSQNGADNANINFDVVMGNGISASLAYDANGNIKAMKQWGLKLTTSSPIDDLQYTYFSNSNKLKTVTDAATGGTTPGGGVKGLGDFSDKNTGSDDYGYDKNGNLTTDLNKKIGSTSGLDLTSGGAITYNHLNQPYTITPKKDNGTDDKGIITYIYDAAGNKLEKRVHDLSSVSATDKTCTYIGNFYYEDSKLQFISHEEGRTRYIPSEGAIPDAFEFDYFVKDHLGNIRMVLTEEYKKDIYQAGMEDANRTFEVALFSDKVNSTATGKLGGFDSDGANAKVSLVNGTTEAGRAGPGVVLKVMAGDIIKASTFAWYQPTGIDNTTDPGLPAILSTLLSQLTPAIAGVGKGTGTEQITNGLLQPGMQSLLNNQTPPASGTPKAYLNWILLDEEQFTMVSGGSVLVPQITGSMQKQLLQANISGNTNIEMIRNGYLYVYVSNESKGNVYFDDIRIEHTRGSLLEETHYYPFGLTMAGISSKAAGKLENRYKFNSGTELNNDFDINLYETECRLYDPQIGRFWQVDELAESAWEWNPYSFGQNNPISNNDPLGLQTDDPKKKKRKYDRRDDGHYQEVLATVEVKARRSNQRIEDIYWTLRNKGIPISRVKDRGLRNRLYKEEKIQIFLDKVHAMTREQDEITLEIASYFIPMGWLTKVRYLKYVGYLFKLKRGVSAFKALTHAAEFGIDTYKALKKISPLGTEVHHLIEKRFASLFEIAENDMKSIVLTKEEHKLFTKAWQEEIGLNGWKVTEFTTKDATKEMVEAAARKIYKDYPEILKALGL